MSKSRALGRALLISLFLLAILLFKNTSGNKKDRGTNAINAIFIIDGITKNIATNIDISKNTTGKRNFIAR